MQTFVKLSALGMKTGETLVIPVIAVAINHGLFKYSINLFHLTTVSS